MRGNENWGWPSGELTADDVREEAASWRVRDLKTQAIEMGGGTGRCGKERAISTVPSS